MSLNSLAEFQVTLGGLSFAVPQSYTHPMVKSTVIARLADGLALAASMDDEDSMDLTEYKTQSKMLLRRVCYLTLCDKSYQKKLAFQYLEELQIEFQQKYGTEVGSVARPYAFVKFDTFIQKVKKQYKDSRSHRNVNKLNDELQDVHKIMTKNIQEVLGRGEQLDRMSHMSQSLSDESKKYLKDSKKLQMLALYQKYGPPGIVALIVLLILYLRFYWFY